MGLFDFLKKKSASAVNFKVYTPSAEEISESRKSLAKQETRKLASVLCVTWYCSQTSASSILTSRGLLAKRCGWIPSTCPALSTFLQRLPALGWMTARSIFRTSPPPTTRQILACLSVKKSLSSPKNTISRCCISSCRRLHTKTTKI